MRLSKAAILALKGMDKEAKQRIGDAVGVAASTVYRWIQDEDDNLTKAAALAVIRNETGLTDQELLEEETESKSLIG